MSSSARTTRARSEEVDESVLLTLQRGLLALEAIAEAAGTATAKSLSRTLGTNLSTTYALIRTLRATGHVVRLDGGLLDVGPRGSTLSRLLHNRTGPEPEISALLTRLQAKTGETAYVCALQRGSVVLQQFVNGSHQLSVGNLEVGYTENLHARASARAIMAFLPERRVELMLGGVPFRQLTRKTCGSYDELLMVLAEVRSKGYALDLEEFADDICCVSVPYFGSDGLPVGSFTVSAPVSRFTVTRTKLVGEVREAAAMATAHEERKVISAQQSTSSRTSTIRSSRQQVRS